MATIKDLAEQYGLEDYEQLLGGYPNATKFVNALQSNIESHIPTTEDLQSPERMGEWSLAAALNQPTGLAIKGYHGSPHKFKEFDTAHMGSGEGGQAYGWGNYITEDPYVATTYSPQDEWMDEQLMNLYNQAERRQDYPSMEVYERYMMHERPNEVKEYLKESYADYPEDLPKRLPAQKIGENLYKKQKGSHLYEVSMEFPKEREAVDPMSIEHFLDYDKPLSEQSDYVRNILQSHDPDMYHPEGPDYDPAEKGSSILQRFGSGKEGAQKLYELGIPGTTYMGEKAKVANPEGVRNFVTYSDEVPRVVTRNMNKVKPLTDEDRLNDLEKQMSAYMKTKRMPKGVDFKSGSDWYDWAYDKRAKLRGYAEGGSVDKDSLQLNKPQRTPNHPTKSHIVKTMVDGKEKIIRFGEQGAETAGKPKEGESDRMTAKRESFKARHAKNIAKGPSSAAYWADKVKWAEGGSVSMEDLPFNDPDQLRLYHQAMQHFDDLMENTGGSKKMGKTEARINYNTTTKGDRDRDKDLHTLIADYGVDVGKDARINATMIKPMEAEGVYLGNLTGSVPVGEGRASLGLQGLHTKYSDGLSGYTAGYNGKVGGGDLSASYFEPADHNSAGRQVQLEYSMPFADGGSVSEFEDPAHERLYRRAMAHFDDMSAKQNFEDNDSMIASTILHPVEAAKRAGSAFMRSVDTAGGRPKQALDESSWYPVGIAPSMDEQAQAGLDLAGLAQTGAMPFAPSGAGSLGTIKSLNFGELDFDPRFAYDKKTKWELPRLKQMTVELDVPEKEIPVVGLDKAVNKGVSSGMSDRSGVQVIRSINDVPVDEYVKGGQPFMHHFGDFGWMSNQGPATALNNSALEMYNQTGDYPFFLPFAMSPAGSDFNPSTGLTMFKYMTNNMNKKEQKALNKDLKLFIPGFKGIETEEGREQFQSLKGDDRKEVQKFLHTNYRDKGGLSIGEVRLAMADQDQLTIPDGTLLHMARLYPENAITKENFHQAYSHALKGIGLGKLDRHIMAHEIYPHIVEERKIADLRRLQIVVPSFTSVCILFA